MIDAAKIGGYFAAHAVWSVSDGATLIPMLAYEQVMMRLVGDDLRTMVQLGRQRLDDNDMNAADAAFLYDGYVTIGTTKLDAILIEMRDYDVPEARFVLAVPYSRDGKFRVHKPKLLEWKGDFDQAATLTAFFEGVDRHEQGSKIWNDALDESK